MLWGRREYDKQGVGACFRTPDSENPQIWETHNGSEMRRAITQHTAVGFTWHWGDGWRTQLYSKKFLSELSNRCVRVIILEPTNAIAHSLSTGSWKNYGSRWDAAKVDEEASRLST